MYEEHGLPLNLPLNLTNIRSSREMATILAISTPSHLPHDHRYGKRQGGVLLTSLSAMSVDIRVARSSPNGSMSEEASKNS